MSLNEFLIQSLIFILTIKLTKFEMDEIDYFLTSPIQPANSYTSNDINEPVKLRIAKNGLASIQPITIPDAFKICLKKYSKNVALQYKDEDFNWHSVNYKEYFDKTMKIAKAFIKIGLKSRDTVAVLAANCPEWFYSELATLFANGIITGIYSTNSPEAVYHVLNTSNATICIVDDIEQLKKIRLIQSRLPKLKSIIQINEPFDSHFNEINCNCKYYKWSEIDQMIIEDDFNVELLNRLKTIAPNECCNLVYTSGTSGLPKAVMLTHDTLIMDAREAINFIPNVQYGNEVFISYLPLNHMAAQIFDIFVPMLTGGCVYFADRDSMKGSLLNTIIKARPTFIFGVPRVWEKLQEKILSNNFHENRIKLFLFNLIKNYSLNYHLAAMNINQSLIKYYFKYWLAKNSLYYVKSYYGLERLKYFLTGGAPTSIETKKFFLSMDMILAECYGLSETSGGICFSSPHIMNFNSVGPPADGMQLKILSQNNNDLENGEICVKGRTVFMGYLNQKDKTDECLSSDGWLHTGDQGYIDKFGELYITGRIKEMVVTSGGENISPINVENLIKAELNCISNAFLVGDRRKYLVVLLTIKTEMNEETGEPLDKLHEETLEWLKKLNLFYENLSEIFAAGPCPFVLKAIDDGIQLANLNSISSAQKVQKFRLLKHDFSVVTGELGPTLKVRRSFVYEKYSELIDEIYKIE